MAKKKISLQVTCTAEFKQDVDDLARSCRQNTSDFLFGLIREVVNANRARINQYRDFASQSLATNLFDDSATVDVPKE